MSAPTWPPCCPRWAKPWPPWPGHHAHRHSAFLSFKLVSWVGLQLTGGESYLLAAFPTLFTGGAWWLAYTVVGLALAAAGLPALPGREAGHSEEREAVLMAKEYFQGEVFDALDPGTVLRGVEYNDCTFKNCRWDGVRIENCSFLSCTFEHCTWSGVVFSFSQMSDAWFSGCAFRSVAWGGLQGRSALVQPFGKAERCEFPVQ